MSTYELTKTIEGRKLNQRTGLPLPEPPVTIPFGSVIDNLQRERGTVRFNYLFELFEVTATVLDSAIRQADSNGFEQPASRQPTHLPDSETVVLPSGIPASDIPSGLPWESVSVTPVRLLRAKVPGGWLLASNGSVTFYPDPDHAWNGKSLA